MLKMDHFVFVKMAFIKIISPILARKFVVMQLPIFCLVMMVILMRMMGALINAIFQRAFNVK